MNRESAMRAVRASISRGSCTPCTWRADRDAYISEKSSELLGFVIDPVPVRIASEIYNYGAKEQLAKSALFAIANSSQKWLLYAPDTDQFSLAFGSSPEALEILGFSSNDALAEWLG